MLASMKPRTVVVLQAATMTIVIGVVVTADWSAAAIHDAGRFLLLGPAGVLSVSQFGGSADFPVCLFFALLLLGVVYVQTGIALAERRPDSQAGLLLAIAGWLWLIHGLRRSSDPILFSLGLASTNLHNAVFVHLVLVIPGGQLHGRAEETLAGIGYA
jgi:hypothetical protein